MKKPFKEPVLAAVDFSSLNVELYKLKIMWKEEKPLDEICFTYEDFEKGYHPTIIFNPKEYNKYKKEFEDKYLFEGKLYSKESLEREFKIIIFNTGKVE